MSIEVEVIGTENVATMIESSGLPRFAIQRKGSHAGATPVYECLDTKNSLDASKSFKKWSNVILQGNPYSNIVYDIICFTRDEEEEGSSSGNAKRQRSGKVRFSFVLTNPFGTPNPIANVNGYQMQQGIDENKVADLIAKAIKEDRRDRENEELKKRVKELEKEIEEGDDEDGDDLGHPLLNMVMENIKDNPKFGFGKKKEKEEKKEAAVNGINEESETEETEADVETKKKEAYIKRINNVLLKLRKHDKDLLIHLEKLAEIAEKKPNTFAMIIENLDNF
ncbi:hypothetical protein CCP1ISM_250005 [Azospirillaceae bacterium]